ncbi:Rossmann-like domain-containing protein [Ferrimonas sp.]|uniref:Rossmann-like domain-containing protein n=1 Tax=Ferrimonas sp. TaxID=2080861 RepID=UPI003A8FB7FD
MNSVYQRIIGALHTDMIPKVQAIHIMKEGLDSNPNAKFGAIELDDGTIGLTYTKLGGALEVLQDDSLYQKFLGQPVTELAKLYLEPASWQQVLGSGALNAISQKLLRERGFEYSKAEDTLALLKLTPGDRVGMVGFFPPLIDSLKEQGIPVTVIELKAEMAREEENLLVTTDPKALTRCNKILITGTTVINHTLNTLLPLVKDADEVALIGPSVGLLPEVLFELGITSVGGRVILDGETFLKRWQGGEKWKNAALRYSLHNSQYQ